MSLTKSEEQLMKYLWRLEKAFFKDLIELYPDPKPATTTVNTLLKRMIDKGFVEYTLYGNSREYCPTIPKDEYFAKHINTIIKDFYDDSPSQFASFFTKKTDLTEEELEELRGIVDKELKKKSR